jgi:DMSO/TMAO reductase YedYZ molybdopterin-dependent catalytic subunit
VTDAEGGPGTGATASSTGVADDLLRRFAPQLQAAGAGVAALAASYAVAGTSPSFVAAPVAAVVVALTPDVVITLSITLLGDAGKLLGLATALVLSTGLFGAAAHVGATFAFDRRGVDGLFAGVVVAGVGMALVGDLPSAAAAGTGAAAVRVAPHVAVRESPDPTGRRELLATLGTAVGAGVLGVGAGAMTGSSRSSEAPVSGEALGGAVGDLLSIADDRSLDVDGLEPLVSESFYNVDIAQFDPEVDTGEWSLTVTGNVDDERTYDYGDVTDREARHRFVTLRCVGEDLNGHKLDTALWTGIPIWDLVEPAGPAENCCVRLRAADDYYQVFPLEALKRGFLAYGMNRDALPRAHGAPARVLIPGHWGEINVKWLTEIELLDEAVDGYWEERGWHGTGPVNTVAKLWVTNHLADGRVEVAGHAYAGTRGVERVEVSTDGGDTWSEATLSDPPPVAGDEPPGTPGPGTDELAAAGRDVWRQWVHRYEPPSGDHEVVVRAVDGTGAVQPAEESGAFPSGATGWVSTTVQP